MTIGNWFKTNIQNNNLSKLFSGIGQTALNAGMTSAMIRQMNRQQSIWGGCCGGNFYGQPNIFGGCCCNSMMYDPLGIANYSGCNDWLSNYNAQMGIQMAQQKGYADGVALRAQIAAAKTNATSQQSGTTPLPKTNWQAADAISSDQDKTAGQKLDQATSQILKNEKGSVTIAKGIDGKDGEAKYQEQISELGKSYGASMDTNGDGYVTLDEYKAAENHQGAETAFNKIDMNGDGKLDWKELAATLRTIDISPSKKPNTPDTRDGKISYEELNKWQQTMVNPDSTTFDTAVRTSYQNLFNPKKKD